MKISMFMPSYNPETMGYGIYQDLGKAFSRLGHNFEVVAMLPEDRIAEAIKANEKASARVSYIPLGEGILSRLLRKISSIIFHSPIFIPALIGYIRRYRKMKKEIDIIHVEIAYPYGAIAALGSLFVPMPFGVSPMGEDILIIEDAGYGYARFFLPRLLLKLTFRRAARVRSISPLMDEMARKRGAPPGKSEVILLNILDEFFKKEHSGADYRKKAKTKIRKKHNIAGDKKIILSLGRLHPFKGIHYLIPGFKMLSKSIPEVVLLICGPSSRVPGFGDYREYLERLAEKIGVRDKIIFTGGIHFSEGTDYLASADIVVVPSILEAMNRVVPEAVAIGSPFIVTETTGVSAFVEEGLLGKVIPPRSPEAICRAALELLEGNLKWDETVRKRFLSHFSPDEVAKRLSRFYLPFVKGELTNG
jgi:glycosyltransferase involved in cell wall biosynthesis